MKISTLILSFLLMACAASAQFVIVNSPADIAGSKVFTNAFDSDWGADLNSGIWTADIIFAEDATANPNQGCEDWTVDAAGKIAVVDRGSCNFSLKALNAQEAGAIGCIIFNANAGEGPVGMAGGDFGPSVTIPTVMLSYEDGQAIRAALANGAVNVTMGAYKFPFDLGTDRANVMNAPMGVIPAEQAEAGGYKITPAAIVTNLGQDDASNVTVSAVINYSATQGGASAQVYDESASIDLLEIDSSAIIGLPEYVPAEGEGVYTMDYTLGGDGDDGNPGNNTYSSRFVYSNNVFCKGGWDFANNRPARTNAYTISGGGNIEFLSGFHMPLAKNYTLDSLKFYISLPSTLTLADLDPSAVNGWVYQWKDLDGNGNISNDELIFTGFAEISSFAGVGLDESTSGGWITIPILDAQDFEPGVTVEDDDAYFLVGVRYIGSELVYFGFDENYDQTVYFDYLAETDFDLPYLGVRTWVNDVTPDLETDGFLFTGFRGSVATALYITKGELNNVAPEKMIATSVSISPNPTSDFLTVETGLVNSAKSIEYNIRDISGRLVMSSINKVNGLYDKTRFDVSDLAAGQYFLVVKTAEGSTSSKFSVIR